MKKSDKMRLLFESLKKTSFFGKKHVDFQKKDSKIECLEKIKSEIKEEIKPIRKKIVKKRV